MHTTTHRETGGACLFHGLQRPKGLSKTLELLEKKAFKNCLQGSMHYYPDDDDVPPPAKVINVKLFTKLIPQSRARERREIPNGNMAGYGSFSQLIT